MKGLIIAAIVGIVLLGGVGYFVLNNNNSPNDEMMTDQPSSSEPTSAPSALQSLKNLMMRGESLTCTYTDPDSGSQGTVYINGEQVRTDMAVVVENKPYNSHMITDGETVYVWQDEMEGGFMMPVNQEEEIDDTQANEEVQQFDLDREVNYQCSPWTVDNSQFVVPQDREFTDPTAMMQDAMDSMKDSMQDSGVDLSQQCAACDQLTGDAAASCRQTLNCQ